MSVARFRLNYSHFWRGKLNEVKVSLVWTLKKALDMNTDYTLHVCVDGIEASACPRCVAEEACGEFNEVMF